MDPTLTFWLSFGVTLALVTGTVVTGRRGQRPRHYVFVASTLASLVVTVVLAERLGEYYDLEAAGLITPVHLAIAKLTTAALLLPAVTGLRTIRRPAFRIWHKRAAYLALAMIALSAITGTWMILAAEPLPEGAPRPPSGVQAGQNPGEQQQAAVGE